MSALKCMVTIRVISGTILTIISENYNFKENNWVYTGGPGSGKTWGEKGGLSSDRTRLAVISCSSETGLRKGRAIGIVQKNDYAKLGVNEDSRIHVLWINKEEEELSTDTRQNAFEKIEPDWNTYAAFQGNGCLQSIL